MCRISYLKEASLRLSVFCIAVTREIVTLHVGGCRCSPDIKQATFLKPESVSADIFLHPLPHHEPVSRDPVSSPELPGGLLFGQPQTQTRGAQQLLRLLWLLPALLWILQVDLRSALLLLQCSTDTTESATWTATAATALPATTTTAETPASGLVATTPTAGWVSQCDNV